MIITMIIIINNYYYGNCLKTIIIVSFYNEWSIMKDMARITYIIGLSLVAAKYEQKNLS